MNTTMNTENEIKGTTQFLTEADTKTISRVSLEDVPNGLLAATRVGYSQGIKEFLAKPIVLSSLVWNTQTRGSVIFDSKIPEDCFLQSVYADKIKGFLGFRAKAVLRLQVNGNKFQAGRLLMVFIPQGAVADTYPDMRTRSLIAATQLPRVELDLSTETEVVMEIPYISPTPFFNRVDGSGAMGRVRVIVYSPLATGLGSTEVGTTLWCHFEDVEIVAPIAQMADIKPKKRINPTENELEAAGEKPISGGLRLAAKAADSFAQVPLLSSVAGPAKWVLECMSGVASAFGYSKPTQETPQTKVQTSYQYHMQNFNGVDLMPNMGMDGSNKMSVLPGFAGTDVDEMCLNHLVQIPAYYTSASWATTDVAGTVIHSGTAHPSAFTKSAIVNLWSTVDCPPISYFSNFFEYWRGSFVITIKIVKTTFHSGRLLVCYDPAGNSSISTTQSAFLLREILDVRESSEFRFVIPFVATDQYKLTNTLTTFTSNTGTFFVTVLNELVAPDTVSSSIDLLFEVAAGPDYELVFPRPHSVAPIILSTWNAQMADVAPSTIAAENTSSRPDRNEDVVAIGSATIVPPSLEPSIYCIGEKVNSILQMMKRYTNWSYIGTGSSLFFSVDVRPFSVGYAYSNDPVAALTIPTGDYYSMFAPCYAYGRGSVRLMVSLPPSTHGLKDTGFVAIYPDETTTTVIRDSASIFSKVGAAINLQPAYGDILPSGAQIPPYQRLHTRLLRPSSTHLAEPVDKYSTPVRASISCTDNGSAATFQVFRAAGDDLTFGYFLGTPLVTVSIAY